MSKYLRDMKEWAAGRPLPLGARTWFYDPITDDEYQLDPSRLVGPPVEVTDQRIFEAFAQNGVGISVTRDKDGKILLTNTLPASQAVPLPAPAPTVTGFLPPAAPIGATVTLTGTGFTRATAALFNGTPTSFQLINATTLIAVVPVDATTGPVAVTNSAGTGTSTANFTVSAVVVVTPPTTTMPDAPFPSFDATTRTLTYQHALGTSELEINHLGGSYQPYAAVSVDDAAHGAGEWKARVKAYLAGNRNASGSADSPAIAAKTVVNRIPVADAGQDITLPAGATSVALMGTASDPDASDTLTYAWRQVTGPNAATGLPAATLNVVASNLVAGTYQFGFRSTDNHGAQSAEDYVLLTVLAAAGNGGGTIQVGGTIGTPGILVLSTIAI